LNTDKPPNNWFHFFKAYDIWLLMSLLLLILYFYLPDATSNGSVISVRFSLLFYLFLIVWLSNVNISKEIQLMTIVCIMLVHFNTNKYYAKILQPMNENIKECRNAANYMAPNSTVIALDYSNTWSHAHFCNYLGIDKPMVVLQNYECNEAYFPLLWNLKKMPQIRLGNLKRSDIKNNYWDTSDDSTKIAMVDYVFVYFGFNQPNDTNTVKIKSNLNQFYSLVSKTNHCSVYKNNNQPYYYEENKH
jgi:hypothetical protein